LNQDTFQLYYRYGDDRPDHDWKTAALRGPALPALGNALAGAIGAAMSNVATYPLSLIVARLQTQKQDSTKGETENDDDTDKQKQKAGERANLLDAARKIIGEEGIGGLYAGVSQDTAKTVADSFLFFLAYTFVRQQRIRARFGPAKRRNVVLPVLDELVVGVVAGAFAKLFTTPLANIVTRKQISTPQRSKTGSSTRDIAAQIRSEKGLSGFWAGYPATLILTLNPSITFFLNEALKYVALSREKRSRPSPFATFLLAAVSKAAASSVTYPFSLAKTRAQASRSGEDSDARDSNAQNTDSDESASLTPGIVSAVLRIARTEGISALYAGLPGEVLKGFFSHGFTMLAKDAVYASVVKSYYLLLIALRRYPSPEELVERARKQAEEYAGAASEGVKDVAGKAKAGAAEALDNHAGNAAVDMTSSAENAAKHGVDSSSGERVPWDSVLSDSNETAELVGDYVEDEDTEWRSLYHWFWEKEKK
jgi:hypothetical protein